MTIDTDSSLSDYAIEYQVISACFTQSGAIKYFADNIPEEQIGKPYGNIGINELYNSLIDYYKVTNSEIVDQDSFKLWLKDQTDISSALGGDEGVSMMLGQIISNEVSPKEDLVSLLKFKHNQKLQSDYSKELNILLSKKGLRSDEEIKRISILTSKINELGVIDESNPFDNLTRASDIINRSSSLLDIPDFLPTQFKSLNRAMGYTDEGGFFKGAVHAVIAPSGKGKSTFAKCLANNWLDCGYKVLYVNFEEAVGHWERILMTQILGENVYSESSKWSEEEKKVKLDLFKDRLSKWGDNLMVRHDPDTPYFEDLEGWLREILGKGMEMPDVVIIDTIQSMFTKGGKGKPRWGEFEEMMVKLEKLARDMNCVLIITAQENANRMKEKRDVVQQSDTGGSLAIQQKCAVTIFITEKRLLSDDESDDENIMQLQIPKNRITGSSFTYDPPMVKYIDSKKMYVEYEIVDEDSYSDGTDFSDLVDEEAFY